MNDIEIFVKEARETSTWLREHLSPEGLKRMFAEGLISQYAEKMEMLRQTDDAIYAWTQDLDSRVKEMKRDLSANRLIDLANRLQALDNLLRTVVNEGNRIKDITEQEIHEFDLSMPKQAGLFDDWKRKWVYEKLQTQKQKERKKSLLTLLSNTDLIIQHIKTCLKKMGKARAHGEIGEYINQIQMVAKYQNQFHTLFLNNYNKYLKPLIDEVARRTAEEQTKAQTNELILRQKEQETVPNQPSPPAPQPVQQLPEIPSLDVTKPQISQPKEVPQPISEEQSSASKPQISLPTPIRIQAPKNLGTQLAPKDEEEFPKEQEAEPMEEPNTFENDMEEEKKLTAGLTDYILKKQHVNFIENLISLANVNINEVPSFILSYSEKIEKQDPIASLKLLAIAEGFIGE